MHIYRTKAPGLEVHSEIKPMAIIEGMGGHPTNMWEDGTQLNLDYDFGTHMISFVYMHGEFKGVELHLEGDFAFRPEGATVQDIDEESNKHKGPWKEAADKEWWPDVTNFPQIKHTLIAQVPNNAQHHKSDRAGESEA